MITTLVLALGIIILILDLCLLIALWIATVSLWRQVWIAYYEAIDDAENIEKEKKSWFAKNFSAKHAGNIVVSENTLRSGSYSHQP